MLGRAQTHELVGRKRLRPGLRLFSGISAATVGAVLLTIGGTVAPAAFASGTPSFQIYYGQDCKTSYRTYSYATNYEAWINDRFNGYTPKVASSGYGYGQLIRDNAASIFVSSGTVLIYAAENPIFPYYGYTFGCHNFDNQQRNQNTGWQAY